MYRIASNRQISALHPLVVIGLVACFAFAFVASAMVAYHYYRKSENALEVATYLNNHNKKLADDVTYWKNLAYQLNQSQNETIKLLGGNMGR